MNHTKIIELAIEAKIKREQINEYYRFLGANGENDLIRNTIKSLENQLDVIEHKLKRAVS